MSQILLLEDDRHRQREFESAVASIDCTIELMTWRNAYRMCDDLESVVATAALISLDHDLYPWQPDEDDPGDGLLVVGKLINRQPNCPVMVHSSNVDRARIMVARLREAKWQVARVAPIGQDWIEDDWKPVCASLLSA